MVGTPFERSLEGRSSFVDVRSHGRLLLCSRAEAQGGQTWLYEATRGGPAGAGGGQGGEDHLGD